MGYEFLTLSIRVCVFSVTREQDRRTVDKTPSPGHV